MNTGGNGPRRRLARWLRRDSSGAGALEFALTVIIAIPLLVGMIEMGRALHSRNALEYLADTVARSTMVELRESGLSLSELEARLLEDARARWTGTAPDRLSVGVAPEGDARLRLELGYRFSFLIPVAQLDDITLRAVRVVPGSTN